MIEKVLKLGTRGSRLALAQAEIVVNLISKINKDVKIEIVKIKTQGDIIPPDRRKQLQGKSSFTKEIEHKLEKGEIDIAVHSLKDLPVKLSENLIIAATPKREDPRDCIITKKGISFEELPSASKVATSSIRRKVQLINLRKDIEVIDIHGNVDTRIRKLFQQDIDAIVLSIAGLKRINEDWRITEVFPIEKMIPAVCQGILAVETRKDDKETIEIVRHINDEETMIAARCERSFAYEMGADCYLPIGAYARLENSMLKIIGFVYDESKNRIIKDEVTGNSDKPEEVGKRLAIKLQSKLNE
ncbi:MAG: hydroxymethylbilane synthase [Thermoproteota archaeon]